MNSLVIILSLLLFKDYKEIRIGMVLSSIVSITILVLTIINLFSNIKEGLILFLLFLVYFLLEIALMPIIWESKRIWKK